MKVRTITAVEEKVDTRKPLPPLPAGDAELIDVGMSVTGWHHAEDFLYCPRWFALRHRARLRFPKSDPLIAGALAHVGVAHYYRRLQCDQFPQQGSPKSRYYEPLVAIQVLGEREAAASVLPEERERWLDLIADAQGVVGAYIQHYSPIETGRMRVMAVEHQMGTVLHNTYGAWMDKATGSTLHRDLAAKHMREVNVPAEKIAANPHGVPYTQRIDFIPLILTDSEKFYLFDHKRVSRVDGKVISRYAQSGQFHGMLNFGRMQWGERFGGAYINFLSGDGKKHPYAFQRVLPPPAPHAVARVQNSVAWATHNIRILDAMKLDPLDWPGVDNEYACSMARYGRPCEAKDICMKGVAGYATAGVISEAEIEAPPCEGPRT